MKRKILIIGILLILLGGFILNNVSLATGENVNIYATHRYGNLLERNNVDLTCIYMVQKMNGEENPAYCLNYGRDGATENYSYDVTISNQITDMELWRTIINGYPYKTPQELGCETKEEAYLATRQAVYCALYQRDPESYHALGGAAGERTLAALKSIVNIARTSSEVKLSPTLTIEDSNTLWQMDNIDKNYVSKEFTVLANAETKDYIVELSGNLIEGIKVTDTNNAEKNTFSNNERFKILIPIKNIEKDGNFSILVNSEVYTKPVFFGASNNDSLQNIAITGAYYEQGVGTKTEYYFKNQTKIIIEKQDQESKEKMANVKFQLLDEDMQVIYSDLITNDEGKIEIDNLLPGKYYVKEIETLENYGVYEDFIEVELELNEETTVTVNNLKKSNVPTAEKTHTELEVEQLETLQEVKQEQVNYTKIKLPKTGM